MIGIIRLTYNGYTEGDVITRKITANIPKLKIKDEIKTTETPEAWPGMAVAHRREDGRDGGGDAYEGAVARREPTRVPRMP